MSKKLQFLLSIVVTVFLLIVIYTTSVPRHRISVFEKIWREIVSPLQRGFSAVSNSITSSVNYVNELKNAVHEVDQLREELAKAQFELERLKEIDLENKRLKELVGFKKEEDYSLLPTRVIGRDPRAWLKTIVIDKGERDGARIGMPVVTYSGVVGHITSVTRTTSQVALLVDPKTAVGGIVQRTRDFVVVDSADSSGLLRVVPLYQKEEENHTLPSLIDFQEGDVVITSGYGGIYPKGLTIGTIMTIKQSSEGVVGTLAPSVDFRRLEEVFLLFRAEDLEIEGGRVNPDSK
ncbi:MAG TPA: rod shape-determining protein MreC [Firmicutes bacterium]|nr:rod shape-determining protein MreC [Bacillota bacterium]